MTRILAAATLASLALTDLVGASAADHYAVAAQRARAHSSHNERAVNMRAGEHRNKKRSVQKRCKASTTSTSAAHTSTTTHKAAPTTTSKAAVTTPKAAVTTHKTTEKESTSTKKATETASAPKGDNVSGGGKSMLSWGGSDSQVDTFAGPNVKFIADWSATPPSHDGIHSISQLWGYKNLDLFRANREKYTYLMGMNEYVSSSSPLSLIED